MGKKKNKLIEFFKKYRIGIFIVGGFVFGIPLVVNGVEYFTETLPQNPYLILLSIIGTIITGVISQFVITQMFEK